MVRRAIRGDRLIDKEKRSCIFTERSLLTGTILFGIGLIVGIAIGSATAVSALTQGAPDVLQSWSGVVALP